MATPTRAVVSPAGERDVLEYPPVCHRLECSPDVFPVPVIVRTEPSPVSGRDSMRTRYSVNVIEGVVDPEKSPMKGIYEHSPIPPITIWETSIPLVVDAPGDTKIAGELDLGNIPNSGVQVLGHPIGIDVREEV